MLARGASKVYAAARRPETVEDGVFPGAVDTDMIRDFPIPKADPADVASAILDGVEAGDEYIFPDPMAQQGHRAWREDPAAFERQMGSM